MVLRQSLLNEVHTDWHPSVPPKKAIISQIFEAKGRIGGNERLATMRVSVGSKMPPMPVLQFMRLTLFLRGLKHKITKKLNGLN